MSFYNNGFDVGTAVAYLDLDATRFNKGLSSVKSNFQTFFDGTEDMGNRMYALSNIATGTGKAMTKYLTLPLTAIGTVATKSAITFESAFTGVRKTVDATSEVYDILSNNIKKMATETASSSTEIAGVMEVAGQLGVEVGKSGESITKFTKIMIELGDSTNISAQEAAIALAEFMNIMGTSDDEVDRLGSSIVDLGNNFATTERDIVNMSLRLASAGKISGLTEQEVLALATAMSSVGIKAEAGGSAMAQTLTAIEKAVENSGEKLSEFARIAGMTTEEFSEAWRNTPMVALKSFVAGLGNLSDQGESATLVLDDLGLSGVRQSNMLKALALSCENMTSALDTSNKAWDENVALSEEASKRYETNESKLKQLKESFNNVAIEIGEILIPFLQKLVDILQKIIDAWNSLPDGMQKAIVYIGLVVSAIGPLLTAAGSLLKIYLEIKTLGGLAAIFGVGGAVASGAAATEVATGIGTVTAATGGLTAALGKFGTTGGAVSSVASKVGTVIAGVGSAALTTGVALASFDTIKNPVINALGKITGETEKSEKMIKRYGYAGDTFRIIGDAVDVLKNKFQGLPPAISDVKDQFTALDHAIESVNKGYVYTDEQLQKIQEKWKVSDEDIEMLRQGMIDAHPEIVSVTDSFVDLNDASFETLQQVSKGLTAMSESGKTVDDVLKGNVKGVKNLTEEASQFFYKLKNDSVSVVTTVGEVEKKVTDSNGKLNETGRNIVKGLSQGINDEKPTAIKSANSLVTDVSNEFKKSENSAKESGSNVVYGFNNGILKKKSETKKNIQDWMSIVSDTIHKELDEHSPSKLSEKSALNVVKGFNIGISSNSSTTNKEISSWMSMLVNTFNSTNYSSYMYNVGVQIVKSIFNGMQSYWGNIANWFNYSIRNLYANDNYNSAYRIAGSYSSGIDYIPYDNYVANLHKGERVLTKEENKKYEKDNDNGYTIIFQSPEAIDEYKAVQLLKQYKKELDL